MRIYSYKNKNGGKALISDQFETHYTLVFWGADYEYDNVNTQKFDFQGQNLKKNVFNKFFYSMSINIDLRKKSFPQKL